DRARPVSRAKPIAVFTSSVSRQHAISAGVRSIIPFQTRRALSKRGSSANSTTPLNPAPVKYRSAELSKSRLAGIAAPSWTEQPWTEQHDLPSADPHSTSRIESYWGAAGCGRWQDRRCAVADPAVCAGG